MTINRLRHHLQDAEGQTEFGVRYARYAQIFGVRPGASSAQSSPKNSGTAEYFLLNFYLRLYFGFQIYFVWY